MGKTYKDRDDFRKKPKKSFKPKKGNNNSSKIKTEYDYNPNYLDEMLDYDREIEEEEK